MHSERFERQVLMAEIGVSGQSKLENSSVAVVGAGGLGYPILAYLAAAGVGRLSVIDCDVVSRSNLNRQLFFTEQDLGASKSERAAEVLRRINPNAVVTPYVEALTELTADEHLSGVDLVIDAVDNIAARHTISNWATKNGVPVLFGAVEGFKATFAHYEPRDAASSCYACLFPGIPEPYSKAIPILGASAGVAGTFQAVRAVRLLIGERVPSDQLITLDLKRDKLRVIRTLPRATCGCMRVRTIARERRPA